MLKVAHMCTLCSTWHPEYGLSDVSYAELNDRGWYHHTCANGHEVFTLHKYTQFEALCSIATNAIVDGYYREAVASFAACLERFFEFYLMVIAHKNGLSEQVTKEMWALIASQSERQLGAFLVASAFENNVAPRRLSDGDVKFRNSVIHKGNIPSKERSTEFGEAVLAIILPLLEQLLAYYPESCKAIVARHVESVKTSTQSKIAGFTAEQKARVVYVELSGGLSGIGLQSASQGETFQVTFPPPSPSLLIGFNIRSALVSLKPGDTAPA